MTPAPARTPQLRLARASDAEACAALVRALSPAFYAHPDGRDTEPFLASIAAERQAHYIAGYRYWVAEVDRALVGLAAARPPQHVFHLFVDAAWQGQGLGSRLMQALVYGFDPAQAATVNASLAAQAFYACWGFEPDGPAQCQHGVRYQPMRRPAT
ncbi:MAG: GNAT family N-acetyltransferase [Inhella sp.]